MAIDRTKVTQQAERLLAQGKIDGAIAQLELLVKDNPRDLNTINRIGDLYARAGRKREAILQFNKIGEHYARDGFFLKAIAIYKKILKLDPAHLDAYMSLAELNAKQGLVIEARSQYEMVGGQFAQAGEFRKAVAAYQALVQIDPDTIKHRGVLADLLVKDSRPAEAVDELVRAGSEMERRGLGKDAKAAYQKAAAIQPDSPVLAARLATVQAASGDLEGAIRMAAEAARKPGAPVDLAIVLGDLYLEAGRHAEARATFLKGLDAAPGRSELRLRLGRTHLVMGDAAAAQQTVGSHAAALVREGKGTEIADLLEEIHQADDSGDEPLRSLVEVYASLKDQDNLVRCNGRLLDHCLRRGDLGEARRLAEALVKQRPADASLKEKLAQIAAMEKGGARAAAPSQKAAQARGGATAVVEEASAPPLDLEVEEAADVEAAGGTRVPESRAPLAPAATGTSDPASSGLSLPPAPEIEGDDEDFITEHMTEAEVFVKYGLGDRAVEQLQAVIARFPGYVPAHQRLKEVHLEEGNRTGARQAMVMLVKSHIAAGDTAQAEEALSELQRFDPDSTEAAQLAALIAPAGSTPAGGVPAATPRQEASTVIEEPPTAGRPAAAGRQERPEAGDAEERVPTADELEEVDFYVEQGLRDEAVAVLRRLAVACGSHPEIVARMRSAMSLDAAAPAPKAPQAGPAAASQAAPEEEEFEIDLADEPEPEPAAPPPAALAPEPVAARAAVPPELDDLAAEIDAALSGRPAHEEMVVDGAEATPEGHSLEEIVHAFKKGIEQQVGEEDHDTHYNLGIAYKEMGLLDEAIGEFQFASKEARLLVDCCSMLGICFREKGMGSIAVKWYRRGIEASQSRDEETTLGLRYDLAELLVEMGQPREAVDLYTEVFGINSKFRDVSARLRDLEKKLPAT